MAGLTVATLFAAAGAAVFLNVLFTSIYRVFLSPLSHIPGPKLAAWTRWYECYYDVVKPAQYVFKIKEMHERYGPIIRITPREVSIADPAFLGAIFSGPGRRNKDAQNVKALALSESAAATLNHDLHRKRREPLNPFFAQARINLLEPELRQKIDKVAGWYRRCANSGEVLNASDLYYAFANDVVRKYCFGHDSDLLADLRKGGEQRENLSNVLRGVKLNLQFPWRRDIISSLPGFILARITPPGIKDAIKIRMSIRKEIDQVLRGQKDPQEAKGGERSIFYDLRDTPLLPPAEKSPARLEDEGMIMVMAGTESTAKSMWIAHYHVVANPAIMAKLRAELAANPHYSLAELLRLPYLNAIITEANRLSFGLTGRNSRIAPDSDLVYTNAETGKNYTIPAGTSMSASTLLIHTNEKLFPDPWKFDPERWLDPEGQDRRKYMISFSKGSRICLGLNLANAEMALVIAELAKWDQELYETDETDVKLLHDYHTAAARLDSKGVRVKVISKRGDVE